MQTIWKYELKSNSVQQINMPAQAKILSVQPQKETVCMWVLVETENLTEKRTFRIYGTGHPCVLASADKHIGTFQIGDGNYVFHVFEIFGENNHG